MAKNRSGNLESYRASLQVAVNENNVCASKAGSSIRYSLKRRSLREGSRQTQRLYAEVQPQKALSGDDLCEEMARHSRTFSASQYRLMMAEMMEEIAHQLRDGNTVSVPGLGLFQVSIGGSFDPEERSAFRKHPVRVNVRVSGQLQEQVNKGAALMRTEELPPCARMEEVRCSSVTVSAKKPAAYDGPDFVEGMVRPEAEEIGVRGVFRNLPEAPVAQIQPLDGEGMPTGAPEEVPVSVFDMPTRRGNKSQMVRVHTKGISRRLLPGTVWRLSMDVGTEPPRGLVFTVVHMPKAKGPKRGGGGRSGAGAGNRE